jgi:hypothetical protein
MAAARQKEMNVSITEEATMSRTRFEGGATIVRLDAIAFVPARRPAFSVSEERKVRYALR